MCGVYKKLGYNRKLVEELSHHVSPKFKLFYRTCKKKGFNQCNAVEASCICYI